MIFCRKIALALFLTSFALTAYSQDHSQEEYYRHFYIQVKNLTPEEYKNIQIALADSEFMEAIEFCATTPGTLVRVNASYPKRVNDIKSELNQVIAQQVAKRRILGIDSISEQNKTNFCK